MRIASILGICALTFATQHCGPGARNAPCRNDGDCADGEHGRSYCVRRHCVQCVTNASCGPHRKCSEGECVSRY